MTYSFSRDHLVEFAETDMAGIVHFSNFFRYMEATEHAFFDSLGLRLHSNRDGGGMSGWARVHAECDYALPAHYRDVLRVELLVRSVTNSTVSYDFRFRRLVASDSSSAEEPEVARGKLVVAHVGRDAPDQRMRARRMPAAVADAIQPAPPELLLDDKKG